MSNVVGSAMAKGLSSGATSVVQETISINVDKLSGDLETLRNLSRRLDEYYINAKGVAENVYVETREKGVTGFDQWLHQNYNVDGIKANIYLAYEASLEAIDRWESYLNDWIQLDNKLAGDNDPTAKYTPNNYTPSNFTPAQFTPIEQTPSDYGRGNPLSNYTPIKYTPVKFTPEKFTPATYQDRSISTPFNYTPPEIQDFTFTPINITTPTIKDYNFTPYSYSFTPPEVIDFSFTPSTPYGNYQTPAAGSNLFGTLPTQSPVSISSTFASSSLFATTTLSVTGGIGSATLSSSSLFSASTVKGGSSFDDKKGMGGSNYALGSTNSNMADALKRGANRIVGSILPVGKGVQNVAALGGLSAAGLAAGGAAMGGGLLLGKNRNYIFKPKDFEKLEEATQNAIIDDLKSNGFEEERIQLFKESTFCIEAKELNEHIRKVEKAYDQNADFSKEYEEMYGFKLFDSSDELVKYLLFVTLIIDGSNSTDEVNIYNIINPSLEEEDVDFIYSGINMEDYIIDGDVEEEEESEDDVKVSKDINNESDEDVPQALAWLREMESNAEEEE